MEGRISRHRLVNPAPMTRPSGYTHAVVAERGRIIHVAGQIASGPDGLVAGGTLVEQFGIALDNLVAALAAAGGEPEDVVSMQIFATDMAGYRAATHEIGDAYRERFGRHYPAMALLGVNELFDPAALIEVVAVAVIPEDG